MQRSHEELCKKYKWYKSWHKNSRHELYHWGVFAAVSFLVATVTLNHPNLSPQSISASREYIDAPHLFKGSVKGVSQNRILVKFKPSVTDTKQDEVLMKYSSKKLKEIKGASIHIVSLPPLVSPQAFAATLKDNEGESILFAEPDTLVSPEIIPNDSFFNQQYSITKTQAEYAWDHVKADGTLLAVCDTGIEGNHPDLVQVLRTDLGYNTVEDSTNWSPIHPHGTMVAGVTAATTNNALGVAGISWGAKIIPVRISNLSDGGAYLSDATECITYAVDNGAKAVNLSYRMAGYAAIDSAASYAESKGSTVIVSAGNENYDTGYADFPTFIAVSATDAQDQRAYFSSYGTYVDIAAPGVSVLTTTTGNQYAYVNGTSFSAPNTMAIIGLMYAAKPTLSPSQVKSILYATADDIGALGEDTYFGAGRINARKALESVLGITIPYPTAAPTLAPSPTATPSATPTPTNTPTPSPTAIPGPDITAPSAPSSLTYSSLQPQTVIINWRGSSDNIGVVRYKIYVNNGWFTSWDISSKTNDTSGYSKVMDISPQYTYTFAVTAVDAAGNESAKSNIITVTAPPESNKGLITGIVTDSAGKPLQDVSVSIKNAKAKISVKYLTNSNGEYKPQVLPLGSYTITTSKRGYRNQTKTATLSSTGQIVNVNFILSN